MNLLLLASNSTAPLCTFVANASTTASSATCYTFDLSQVPAHTWSLNTSTCPLSDCNLYYVAAPCGAVAVPPSGGRCAATVGQNVPAFQVPNKPNTSTPCVALGALGAASTAMAPIPGASADAPPLGMRLEYTSGAAGRKFVYWLMCNDNDQGGPDAGRGIVEHPSFTYSATWSHKGFCPVASPGACGSSPVPPLPPAPTPTMPPTMPQPASWGTVPLPTPPQLNYYSSELRALIHFNMATFIHDGDPGCSTANWLTTQPYATGPSGDEATFNPTLLNISQWVDSMRALGVANAVLTAKHGCGHLLWPTKVTLPARLGLDDSTYTYTVGRKQSAIAIDVVGAFAKEMKSNGIGCGFYYSLTNNFYLNVEGKVANEGTGLLKGQVPVNQSEFESIAWQQLAELWQNYGAFTEVWLDGGYPLSMLTEIKEHLTQWQPNAVAWNGLGNYDGGKGNATAISPNAIRWAGTESGLPNGEFWATASEKGDFSGLGDPDSPVFAPPGCDSVLQSPKAWFFTPGSRVKTLAGLQNMYHETVGRNCVIELDFAINRQGLVEPSHAAAYSGFGSWINECYGAAPRFTNAAVAATSGTIMGNASTSSLIATLVLELPAGTKQIDRAMVQEDLGKGGQRIRSFTIDALVGVGSNSSTAQWVQMSAGHSVGNKRIDVFKSAAVGATKLRLTVVANAAAPVYILNFAAFTGDAC